MIKEKIVNCIISDTIIQKILWNNIPINLRIIIFLMDLSRMMRFYLKYGWKFQWLENIEWKKEYNINKLDFEPNLKKEWISGYMRLKNAWDFLEETVESAITYCDEIIMVENGSEDNTKDICRRLEKKYPWKIKLYIYEPEVYTLFSSEFSKCPENSIHSFSYMSNYTLSKVNYKYALKIDDDQIFIPENIDSFIKNLRVNGINNFCITPLLNIQKENQKFVYSNKNYRASFSWLFSDIWFHPVSRRIYFHSNWITEWYVHNYFSKILPISFLHLKLLKKSKWFKNYHKNGHSYLDKNYKSTHFSNLDQQYVELLHKYNIHENW